MAEKTEKLKHLETLHPRAKEMAEQWKEIDDVVFDKVRHKKEDYLPQGDNEPSDGFDLRKTLARFKGETPGILSKAVGAVFTTPPTRPKAITEKWSSLIDNADGTGVDLNTYLEDSLFEALAFGASLILVDKPVTVTQGEGDNRADTNQVIEKTSKGFQTVEEIHERKHGELLLVRFKLPQVTNWSVDRRGELNWIRIKENSCRQDTPDDKAEDVVLYWEWDRKSWRRWKVVEKNDGVSGGIGKKVLDAEIEDSGDHNLGLVPLAILPTHRNGSAFSFESAIRYAYHWDIEMFQDWSDLRYDTYMHAHPTKYRKTSRKKSEVGTVGPNTEVNLEEDEEVGYIQYPTSATSELRANVDTGLSGVRRAAGIDPLGSGDNAAAMGASGKARTIAFTHSERRFLQRYAKAVRSVEVRVFEIAERWESDSDSLTAHDRLVNDGPSYSQRFDSSSSDELISAWSETRGEINSDSYDREVQKKIVDSVLPDIPSERREAITSEIDTNPLIGKSMEDMGDDPSLTDDASQTLSELDELSSSDFDMDEDDSSADGEAA